MVKSVPPLRISGSARMAMRMKVTPDIIDGALWRTHGHETADHEGCPIGDHGHGLSEGQSPHGRCFQEVTQVRATATRCLAPRGRAREPAKISIAKTV